MTKLEAEKWCTLTNSSKNKWTLDEITANNKGIYLFYIGGEEGNFIEVLKTGLMNVGTYQGAFPHIGEAIFPVLKSKQFKDQNAALDYLFNSKIGMPILQALLLGQSIYTTTFERFVK